MSPCCALRSRTRCAKRAGSWTWTRGSCPTLVWASVRKVGENRGARVGTSVSRVEIVEGLNPGDVIIMSDMSRWDNVDRVRIK